MATLREVIEFVVEVARQRNRELPQDLLAEIEREIQMRFSADRIYVPPPNSRKDPARTEAIREAARKLPTRVVAERFGVSRQWVGQVVKGRK